MIRKLGGGDLGAVYQAEELATGNTVALKILLEELDWDPEYVKQCRWEARFAAASNPSNIVRVYDVDRSDQGRVFIVMEYLEGENLANVIRRDGPLEMSRALRLAGEIAQALATATKSGVTHRNLKPQNVMLVGPDERVKVTDFGIARLRETVSDGRLGIGEYAAPEQLKSGEVTDRTDIYSLGAVLYTMLTGSSPSTSARAGAAGAGDLDDAPTPVRKPPSGSSGRARAVRHAGAGAAARAPPERDLGVHRRSARARRRRHLGKDDGVPVGRPAPGQASRTATARGGTGPTGIGRTGVG